MYDVIIIGGGPAGLSAGLYSARAKMKTLIIEKSGFGGQMATTTEIENYPGAIYESTGKTLTNRMLEQVNKFNIETIKDNIIEMDLFGDIKKLRSEQNEYLAKSVIIASGASPRKLGLKEESKFVGKGLSYCATCDADFFTDLPIVVIGGGDTAVEEALYLSKFGSKVIIFYRGDKLRANKTIQEKAFKNDKIDIVFNTVLEKIDGNDFVEKLHFKNTKTNENFIFESEEGLVGLFVLIGNIPNTNFLPKDIVKDDLGYILTDENMNTNIQGVFAVGDLRVKSLRQIVTAVSDGAIASVQAEKYIENV